MSQLATRLLLTVRSCRVLERFGVRATIARAQRICLAFSGNVDVPCLGWQDNPAHVFERHSCERDAGDCGARKRDGPREPWKESQGDDTLMDGEHEDLLDPPAMMTAEFTCHVGPVIGLADGLAVEGECLNKTVRVTSAVCPYEANQRHCKNYLRVHGLENCRGVTTLGVKHRYDTNDEPLDTATQQPTINRTTRS